MMTVTGVAFGVPATGRRFRSPPNCEGLARFPWLPHRSTGDGQPHRYVGPVTPVTGSNRPARQTCAAQRSLMHTHTPRLGCAVATSRDAEPALRMQLVRPLVGWAPRAAHLVLL